MTGITQNEGAGLVDLQEVDPAEMGRIEGGWLPAAIFAARVAAPFVAKVAVKAFKSRWTPPVSVALASRAYDGRGK